jgi:hypothetical protein
MLWSRQDSCAREGDWPRTGAVHEAGRQALGRPTAPAPAQSNTRVNPPACLHPPKPHTKMQQQAPAPQRAAGPDHMHSSNSEARDGKSCHYGLYVSGSDTLGRCAVHGAWRQAHEYSPGTLRHSRHEKSSSITLSILQSPLHTACALGAQNPLHSNHTTTPVCSPIPSQTPQQHPAPELHVRTRLPKPSPIAETEPIAPTLFVSARCARCARCAKPPLAPSRRRGVHMRSAATLLQLCLLAAAGRGQKQLQLSRRRGR